MYLFLLHCIQSSGIFRSKMKVTDDATWEIVSNSQQMIEIIIGLKISVSVSG